MVQIIEDYVSYETAKLLKEKGFDEECRKRYASDDNEYIYDINELTLSYDTYADVEFYLCPTLQMVMKWLREVHNLEIYPNHNSVQKPYNWWCSIYKHFEDYSEFQYEFDADYPTYEEVCEEAIKYCLENLI